MTYSQRIFIVKGNVYSQNENARESQNEFERATCDELTTRIHAFIDDELANELTTNVNATIDVNRIAIVNTNHRYVCVLTIRYTYTHVDAQRDVRDVIATTFHNYIDESVGARFVSHDISSL